MIDFVIIGLNSEKYLGKCIESCLEVTREFEESTIVYVDGGSNDNSVNLASNYDVITIISNAPYPSPGNQRNLGFKHGKNPYVMFLDGDTVLNKNFILKGIEILKNSIGVGGVFGRRVEKYPKRNSYHIIADIEWNKQLGTATDFGGDVLLKREVLNLSGGYKEELVGGEDPELARRIIKLGYEIIGLDILMTVHDINMDSAVSYIKRAYRSGYGFGVVHHYHKEYWTSENKRILIRGLLVFIFFFLLFIEPLFFIPFVIILFKPRLIGGKKFIRRLNLDEEEGKIYQYHASIVIIPQFLGLIRFYIGLVLKKPLRNKRRKK